MNNPTNQDYKTYYHTYPVYSADLGFEGATKRFKSFPTPEDIYRRALRGLPKFYPLTGEPITVADAAEYLESAISEIEMSLNMNLSPVEHHQSFDYIDGLFASNFTGLKLERWPCTEVTSLVMKFPHTQTLMPGSQVPGAQAYQTYTIPSAWVALRRNRINVVAAFGAVSVQAGQTNVATAGGVFSYITGFARGAYQPGIIECRYTAGFQADRLPTTIYELVVTLASLRFLEEVAAVMFPTNSVSVSIDGVNQSASTPGPALLTGRIEALRQSYTEKTNAITRNFGNTMKLAFIGA